MSVVEAGLPGCGNEPLNGVATVAVQELRECLGQLDTLLTARESLQQKMNMADDVSGDDDSSSSDENDTNGKSSGPFDPSNTTNKLAVPNPQSDNKCDTSMSSSQGLTN